MQAYVYDKTDKGCEEIATRKYALPPRLRTLLVMIDGKQTMGTVLHNIGGLGLSGDSVAELLEQDYIHLIKGEDPAPEPVARPAPRRGVRPVRRPPAAAVAAEVAAEDAPVEEGPADGDTYLAVLEFYTQTIRNTLGLRGLMLQLKVEQAATLDDMRALRLPYLQAVLKSKGAEMARSLRDRLDKLLGGAPEPDEFAL